MDADELCWGPLLQKSEPRGLRLSGKGTKQQDYLWHLAMTSPLHATKSLPIQPGLTFCHIPFLFSVSFFSDSKPCLHYCLFNALLHRLRDLWMYSAAQHCWAIVLAVPETLPSSVIKVRTFLSTVMTPGGESQGSCSSRASVQIVFCMFSSTSWWPRNKSHWRSLSLC